MKLLRKSPYFSILVISVLVLPNIITSAVNYSVTQEQEKKSPDNSQDYDFVIVEFNAAPAASITPENQKLNLQSESAINYVESLRQQHETYKSWLNTHAKTVVPVRDYTIVLNGIAVKLNGQSIDSLMAGPGVRSITPSIDYYPLLDLSIPTIDADLVWSSLNVDPTQSDAFGGIKIGVIDTGIDDSHDFLTSCRTDPIPHKVFYTSENVIGGPAISSPHGTQVAGIIGGCVTQSPVTIRPNPSAESKQIDLGGPISGVAPGVGLFDYNVFPGFGNPGPIPSGATHDIIAAVEEAVLDGMDIINLSLGGAVQGPHDVLDQAVNRAVDAGVVVVVAAGNEGGFLAHPLTVTSPGTAEKAITVGASLNGHFVSSGTRISFDNQEIFGVEGQFNSFDPAITAELSLTTPNDGCSAIQEDLTGKVAIIDRGGCSFSTKINRAQDAGSVGVIVVNNFPIAFPMAHVDFEPFPNIPAIMIGSFEGVFLKSSLPTTATIDDSQYFEQSLIVQDYITFFSSVGPTPFDFRTKPDIIAPGENVITSASDNAFELSHGTSVAAPHVSGAAALLLASQDLTPAQVKSALVNHADRSVQMDLNTLNGIFYGPFARGGGRVNVNNAFLASLVAEPSIVSFGGFVGEKPIDSSVSLTFENLDSTNLVCDLSLDNSYLSHRTITFEVEIVKFPTGVATVYTWSDEAEWSGNNYISFSQNQINLEQGGTQEISISFNGDREPTQGWSFGDIIVDCGNTGMRIPWSIVIQKDLGRLGGFVESGALNFDLALMSEDVPEGRTE